MFAEIICFGKLHFYQFVLNCTLCIVKTIEKEKETRAVSDSRPKALAGATTTNVYVDGAKVAEVRQQAAENPISNVIEFGKAQVVK